MSTRSDPYLRIRQVVFTITMVAMTALMVAVFLLALVVGEGIAELYSSE